MIKKIIKISTENNQEERLSFWKSKSPEERVEAVEIIREHYYSQMGYGEQPWIKRIIRITEAFQKL